MSRESIESFFRFMSENKDCQDRVKGFGEDMDGLAAWARGLGYDFSPEEMRAWQDKARELLKSKVLKFQPSDSARAPGARAFYELTKLAETDEAVANELAALAAGTPEELVAYGKEKGYAFTKEDLKDFGKDILEQDDELSDEELEAAAGGTLVIVSILACLAIAGVGAVAVSAGAAAAGAVGVGVAAAVSEVF